MWRRSWALYYREQIRRTERGGGVWGLTVGANEVLNVRGIGWIGVGKVNGCQDGGSESREATARKKLQIEVRKTS